MRITNTHVYFWGYKDIFSNFYKHRVFHNGASVHCSEVAFMMEKALFFNDKKSYDQLVASKKAAEAKDIGRHVTPFDPAAWDAVRYEKMKIALRSKFKAAGLRKQLLDTGNLVLVEASPPDKVWGVGLAENDPLIENEKNWKGQNLLGKALMDIRAELRQ